MANGFFLPQYQPLDYRATVAGAGAPLSGLMGGIQQGVQLAGQLEEMQASRQQREMEQQALQQQATQQEQMQALSMQAAQGDPEAQQMLMAVNPEAAMQMQNIIMSQQQADIKQQQAEREAAGSMGSLLRSGKKDVVRATYERAVARIRKENDHETELGLPSREDAKDMSDDELYKKIQSVGERLEAYGLGPQAERAPLVQVGGPAAPPPFKVPAGYMLKDPNNPSAGVMPIPGTELEKKVKVGKFTEGQTTAARYAYNMVGASDALKELKDVGVEVSSIGAATLRKMGAAGRYMLSTEDQRIFQAQEDWVAAKLRKESGAAIPPEELESQRRIYFPQPGDDVETRAQKSRSRDRAQKGMIASSQGAYKSLFKESNDNDDKGAIPPGEGKVVDWSSL